jgi:hypothetical protein
LAIAQHAVRIGLLPEGAIDDVQTERCAEMDEPAPDPEEVEAQTIDERHDTLTGARLQHLLEQGDGNVPPNVVIEPNSREPQRPDQT